MTKLQAAIADVRRRLCPDRVRHDDALLTVIAAAERVPALEVAAERYQVLRGRHFENCPGDSAVLWSGSQYEHCAADLDALADYVRSGALGCNVDELPERVAATEGSEA